MVFIFGLVLVHHVALFNYHLCKFYRFVCSWFAFQSSESFPSSFIDRPFVLVPVAKKRFACYFLLFCDFLTISVHEVFHCKL